MNWTTRLLVAAVAAASVVDVDWAAAQARVGVQAGGVNVRAGGRGGYRLYGRRPWFGNAAVRRQLKIDDDQYNTLNKAYVQYWTPYNQVVVGVPADLDEQQRQQRLAAAYGTFHKDFNTASAKVFVDPDIRNRYNQLNLQYQGYAAFNDPTVQTRLRLTDEQRQNFNRYYTDWNQQMNTYADEYAKDRDGVNRQFAATWKQQRDRINETLTPEQRKSWNEMTGEAYDFPADAYFDDGDDRGEGRENPGRDNPRDNPGRDNPPRNPAPGAGPRENPPRNPAPSAGPRENPPRNPAPGGTPRGEEIPRDPAPRTGDAPPRNPAPANPR